MDIFDWTKIRVLHGSQANGFEEFCAQLARAECPEDAQFERKGTPDAGVECFCRLIDGGEWGWQAKYFDTLGPSQWSQLDDSVKTVLGKHPALVCYYVCVPLDRADARGLALVVQAERDTALAEALRLARSARTPGELFTLVEEVPAR